MSEQELNFEEESVDILTLLDEEGAEHQFELVDTAEFEGAEYVALIPVFENADELLEDSGELVIMKVTEEDGEEFLDAIEDDGEYERVGQFFEEHLSDLFDFE